MGSYYATHKQKERGRERTSVRTKPNTAPRNIITRMHSCGICGVQRATGSGATPNDPINPKDEREANKKILATCRLGKIWNLE